MDIIKIAYHPDISSKSKKIIKDTIVESMTSDCSNHYFLESILEELEGVIEKKDWLTLKKYEKQDIEYIEF